MKYRPEFPHRFGGHDEALGHCRSFFGWYNDEHYHTGIGLLTPAVLHSGTADQVLDQRASVLEVAYAKYPERFVRGCPKRQSAPEAVWINPPIESQHENKKGHPETHCPGKPLPENTEASYLNVLTHPRPGYPLTSCVPAELASVSPGEFQPTDFNFDRQPPLNTRAMPEKIPGVRGLAPEEPPSEQTTMKAIH